MPDSNEEQLKNDITLLDNLLGVEARKPGNAAKLPAAIRIIEKLEPAGGKQVPVFPASYLGDDDNPTYDFVGVEYGEIAARIQAKERERLVRPILRATMCAIDSPQSQANRMEPAFLETELKELVPQAVASIPRKHGNSADSVLLLPHRIADFRMRLSNQKESVEVAIRSLAEGNALPLLRLMPTSLIFGFWDSRADGYQHKHARILLSRIDAHDVIPCQRHAIYSGPYSKSEFADVVLEDGTRSKDKKDGEKMSGEGFTNAVGSALGGVLVAGDIERLSVLSLTDIARINCVADSDSDRFTNAARRYLFALAALAEAYPRSQGSHNLRSGCELVRTSISFTTRGADYAGLDELRGLYDSTERLKAVAMDARSVLSVPGELSAFEVTKETLAGTFKSSEPDETTDSPASTKKAAKKAAKKSD